MARLIRLFDTTLRDGEQAPGCSMNIEEKLRVARSLMRLKVDIIEAGFAVASPGDYKAVEQISLLATDCTVASLARAVPGDIEAAAKATAKAASPLINVFIATSHLHMKAKLGMSPEAVLERIAFSVAYARKRSAAVEFSAEDATRSDPAFLAQAFGAAIRAGASVVNIADTVGYCTPEEMRELVQYLLKNIPDMEKALLSVHCHDDLGMAVANTLSAIRAGASQADCSINGIGERAGNAALEEVVMALKVRPELYGAKTRVDSTALYRASRRLSQILSQPIPPNKAVVGANAFAHESGIHQHGVMQDKSTYEIMTPESVGQAAERGIVLGKHSGKHALFERMAALGYRIPEEFREDLFERFKRLCDNKKEVLDYDLEALVEAVSRVKEYYSLLSYKITSSNASASSAELHLKAGEQELISFATASGPVLAAYQAIDRLSPIDMKLEDYSIRSVTEGQDAQGHVSVKVSDERETVSGSGLSHDILEASVLAYVNALNKLLTLQDEG